MSKSKGGASEEVKVAVTQKLRHSELVRLRCLELALASPRGESSASTVARAEDYREYIEAKKIPSKASAKMRRVK